MSRSDPDHARESFRRAFHLALNDGAITHEEEEHLAHLAKHLGIGAPDALALKREVVDSRSAGKQKG